VDLGGRVCVRGGGGGGFQGFVLAMNQTRTQYNSAFGPLESRWFRGSQNVGRDGIGRVAISSPATSRSSRPLRGLRATFRPQPACANPRISPVLATFIKRPQQPAPDRKRYGETLLEPTTSCSPGSRSRTACCGLGGVLAMSDKHILRAPHAPKSPGACTRPGQALPAPACAHQALAPLVRVGLGRVGGGRQSRWEGQSKRGAAGREGVMG
jgi:hypothetical protein